MAPMIGTDDLVFDCVTDGYTRDTDSGGSPAVEKKDVNAGQVSERDVGSCPRPTFKDAALERDFIAYCQIMGAVPSKRASLIDCIGDCLETAKAEAYDVTQHRVALIASSEAMQCERTELLTSASHYTHLPLFDQEGGAEEICGRTLLQPFDLALQVRPWTTHSSFATLCATRLLTVTEEISVIRRLHLFRHMASQILANDSFDAWDLLRARALLSAAIWHRDLMVQANMRLVVAVVKKLPVSVSHQDELVSDGSIALLRAVEKFDPRRGYRFCTYAMTVVRRECFRQLQILNASRDRTSQATTRMLIFGCLHNAEGPDTDRSHWMAWRKRLLGMMDHLNRREQVIIRSRFGLGARRRVKTLQRLADALKISKERVRQLEQGAIMKLRKAATNASK